MTKPSDLDRDQRALFDVWRSLGLSEESAMNALREDGQLEVSGFDAVARSLRNVFGLSVSESERAVAGRTQSVSEARRGWDSAGRSAVQGSDYHIREAQRLLDAMSDEECDQLVQEQRRRRTSAKKAAVPPKQSGGKKVATISETSWR